MENKKTLSEETTKKLESVQDVFLPVAKLNSLDDVILIDSNAHIKTDVINFMKEQRFADDINDYNLPTSRSVMFAGAPGMGKTFLAKAMAKEMNIPLYIMDIGKVLSNTETGMEKIDMIFRFVTDPKNQPCILFMDECDGLAKSRENKNVNDDVKRMTNKIMQELQEQNDSIESRLVIIAATNFLDAVDEAFLSRFQLQEYFLLPDNYVPFIEIEVKKNKMFELVKDVDQDSIDIINKRAAERRFSIREVNAKVLWCFKQEIIKRKENNRLDGEVIPIKLSNIMQEICNHIQLAYTVPSVNTNSIDSEV